MEKEIESLVEILEAQENLTSLKLSNHMRIYPSKTTAVNSIATNQFYLLSKH